MLPAYLEEISSAMADFPSVRANPRDVFYASWAALARLCGTRCAYQLSLETGIVNDRPKGATHDRHNGATSVH